MRNIIELNADPYIVLDVSRGKTTRVSFSPELGKDDRYKSDLLFRDDL